jgi:hydrogenase expression/formation protein HypD
VKARGGDVRIVYSPLDAVDIAREHPSKRWCSSRGLRDDSAGERDGGVPGARRGLENFSC